MARSRVGICFLDRPDPLRQVRAAKLAEERGFESVWVCETRLARDAFTIMGAMAANTSRILLGTGIVNSWTRGPALMALTFATLDEMAPGRTICGLGAYWDPLAYNQGIERTRPLTQMREYTEVFRRLMNLERFTYEGEVVKVRDIELDLGTGRERLPMHCPVYIGATGPQMLESSATYADGILLNAMMSTEYTRNAIGLIRKGAEKAGRTLEDLQLPQLISTAMDDDGDKARDMGRRIVTMYLGQQPHIAQASGFSADFLGQIHEVLGGWPPRPGGLDAAMKLVDDETVTRFVVAGTPDECLKLARGYVEAGATYAIPLVVSSESTEQIIEVFAEL
ncbi:MAG: LLM class flavin-dependent oxidoreductase [Kouleothrix sp.]|jgi:5,10-methylenetetrahydromethanopterin reductase|nr:LLM class flavin-dependent oxidoreductase [Kouleothrix sp.]